jgi:hypothetical protein
MGPYAVLSACCDVPEALAALARMRWAGKGLNMVIADREGRIAAVEKSYDRQATAHSFRTTLFRTNHFVSPELVRFNQDKPTFKNSCARFHRLMNLFGDRQVKSPYTTLKRVMQSHDAGGICQHISSLDTLSAAIMNPKEGWMEVCGGHPCSDDWIRFSFADPFVSKGRQITG